MDKYTATELAFKHGYEKGYEAAKKEEKHGRWLIHKTGKHIAWAECSECHVCGSSQWKRCPVCEAKMTPDELEEPEGKAINVKVSQKTMDALKKMGEKAHGE